jgi:hypothetical protein
MPSRRGFPLVLCALSAIAAIASVARPARADDNILRGPYPFRRDNQASVHVLFGSGAATR